MLTMTVAFALVALERQTREPEASLEQLVSMMEGEFSSEEQAAADAAFFDIRLHMARVWKDQPGGGVWLYVEQATASAPEKPYRQRVYHVSESVYRSGDGSERNVFVSEVWTLPGDALRFTGAWRDPAKLDGVKPADLTKKDGCEVWLVPGAGGTYAGATLGDACPSERQGATHAESRVKITAEGLTTWDRGFDAAGKQVWGSEKGAYVFKRRRAE